MRLHKKLKNRVIVSIKIEAIEDIHVGGEKDTFEPSATDLPIVKDKNEKPYIPGSSLKGVLKSYLERLIESLDNNSRIITEYNILKSKVIKENEFQEAYNKSKGDLSNNEFEVFSSLGSIKHLFGASGFASQLKFSDAILENKENFIDKRTHVRIDIDTGVAMRGQLVSLEYIPLGSKFISKLIFDELDDPLVHGANALFYMLLKMLYYGIEIHIGGWSSRGYGLSRVKVNKIDVYSPEDLILNKKATPYSDNNILDFIETQLNHYGGQNNE